MRVRQLRLRLARRPFPASIELRRGEGISASGDPAPQMRPCQQVEAPLVRDMRVGDERNIRDREVASRKPITSGELGLHVIERFLAAFHTPRLAGLPRLPLIKHVRAANGNVRFVTVLFPEKPLVDFRLYPDVIGQQARAAREESQNPIRLGKASSVEKLDRRHLALGKLRQKNFCTAAPACDVDRHPFVGQAEMVGDEAHFLAVAGLDITVDFELANLSRGTLLINQGNLLCRMVADKFQIPSIDGHRDA
jgi:hypothetical protein